MVVCSLEDCKCKAARLVGDCKYCSQSYCLKHRLPETHLCLKYENCRKEAFSRNECALNTNKCISNKVTVI